jgi:hypothetical protein
MYNVQKPKEQGIFLYIIFFNFSTFPRYCLLFLNNIPSFIKASVKQQFYDSSEGHMSHVRPSVFNRIYSPNFTYF